MLIGINKLSIKTDFNKAQALFTLHFFLFFLAKGYEFFKYQFNFIALFGIIFFIFFYRLYYRTQKNLKYSFWSLTALSFFIIIFHILRSLYHYNDFSIFFLYTMSFFILGVLCFSLYSPVFFPIINWWEYDFRYRNDLKASVYIDDDKKADARIVDLRRRAGGLSMFEEVEIGQRIDIELESSGLDGRLQVEVLSKRQYSIGRPYTYGVRFVITDDVVKRKYNDLEKYWNFERKAKKNKKFKS
ncbi:hypothetical protein [Halobacteriovorax sp.]|uniref:hypothetical protein n=1 Tax=Halobacteriovorax sp. TaxID=2020862 RepID=UPI003AF2FEAA